MNMKKSLFALIFVAAFSANAFAQQEAKNSGLFWVRENGKYGYIDARGKTVIAPQFENTMGFNEGLAATKLGGKYGYIDTRGNWAIRPQFDFTYVFSDGLAMVRVGKQYAWIDRAGKTVIPAQDFDEVALGFTEGRLAVKKTGKWGYIDRTGKMVVEPKFKKATKFEGGAAQVETEDGMHHWIAPDGKIIWSQKQDEKRSAEKH
jgi:hypothetical protein